MSFYLCVGVYVGLMFVFFMWCRNGTDAYLDQSKPVACVLIDNATSFHVFVYSIAF